MEANAIWERKIEAEIRSLYFADLTTRFTLRKQIITGLAFFLSTASAATVIGKFPWYVPVALSAVVALATGYSIATGLDRRISTLSKLHSEWNSLWGEYDRLWNRWYDDETNETPVTALAGENSAPTNLESNNIVKLRMTLNETAGSNGINQKFRLQYSTFSDFSQNVNFVVSTSSCVIFLILALATASSRPAG